ncbi:S8 family serine peptidase [Carboxylicivirga sp. RSCT41]|uniref:S8 family serine peptidase n=1 Tax=Carboxylicivirga agarovorans TaxID=3417570 RepID=UPI003D32DE47
MKHSLSHIIIAFLLVLSSFVSAQVSNELSNDFVKGKIRIKLKKENLQEVKQLKAAHAQSNTTALGIESIDALNDGFGIKRIQRVFPFSIKHEAKHREYGLHLWFELDFDPAMDPQALSDEYRLLEDVAIAKPVYKKILIGDDKKPVYFNVDSLQLVGKAKEKIINGSLKSSFSGVEFNDPRLPEQWHYYNDGAVGSAGEDIDLLKAWSKSVGSKDVIVAIVDGGIDTEHEDLKDNLWVNEAELNGEEGVDDDQNGYVDDIYGYNFVYGGPVTAHKHGTHVAGTVGAVSNNGIGVAGVAGGDGSGNGVRLMSCQIYDERPGGNGNQAAAIVYGADHGAVISQNSWGYTQPGYFEPEVYDAVKYFIAEAGQYEGSPMNGGIFIAAAGNAGREHAHYPASFEEALSVASTGPTGMPAPYSNYGEWVDITAPGGDQAYFEEEGGVLSTLPGNTYGFYQGTSMACPHVSGVAALVVAKYGGPSFRPNELRKLLLNSANAFDFEDNGEYGVGKLNALNALMDESNVAPDKIEDLRAKEVFHNEMRLEWTVPRDSDNFQPKYFHLAIDLEQITKSNFDQQALIVFENAFEAGDTVAITIHGLRKQTSYYAALKSSDRFENVSEISNVIQVITTDEPQFTESTREVYVEVDVNNQHAHSIPVTFSNTGEGIVYWRSFTINENAFWTNYRDWEAAKESALAQASLNPEQFEETRPLTQDYTESQLKGSVPYSDLLLENDNTAFKETYSYITGGPRFYMGTGNANAGLILATRFRMPADAHFNMTHLQFIMYPNVENAPVHIEIRKSKEGILQNSEVVYHQEYVPKEVNKPQVARIPLLTPQRFENLEYFWVVLYFSPEEDYPMMMERSSYSGDYTDYFLVSRNNGVSYMNAFELMSARVAPMLEVCSSGRDGSFTYLAPYEGEIQGGETQEVQLNIEAGNLSNGKHSAAIGVYTNDAAKPGIAIDVLVDVTGQKAEAEIMSVNEFEVLQNKPAQLELSIKNIGLDTLKISSIKNVSETILENFTNDTIIILPGEEGHVPFSYTALNTGRQFETVSVETNIGTQTAQLVMDAKAPAEISLSLDMSEVTLAANETQEVQLTITNASSNAILEYSLEEYGQLRVKGGNQPNKLGYQIVTSNDVGGPQAGRWDEIKSFAEEIDGDSLRWHTEAINLGMKFPFENNVLSEIWAPYGNSKSVFYFYNYGVPGFFSEEMRARSYDGSGVFAPLWMDIQFSKVDKVYFHSYGDRIVLSVEEDLVISRWYNDKPGRLEYQVVLFRDGSIEYRYKDVSVLSERPEIKYAIGIQGILWEDYYKYKDFDDETNLISDGLVIRFEPQGDVNISYTENNVKGALSINGSVSIPVTIDPSIAIAGEKTLINHIRVKGNTVSGQEEIPVNINITGSAVYDAQDSIDFNWQRVGELKTLFAKVENSGTANASIIALDFSDAAFSTTLTLPQSLPAHSNVMIPVVFESLEAKVHDAFLTVTFEDGSKELIVIKAEGRRDPLFTYVVDGSLNVDLTAGEPQRIPLSMAVDANSDELSYAFSNGLLANVTNSKKPEGELVNELLAGVFDYQMLVSDSQKVFHKWDNIKGKATKYKILQDRQQMIELPFSFPFYGELYDTIWVSKNGYITVNEPYSDATRNFFAPNDGLNGMIAPLWVASLEPSIKDDGVWYQASEKSIQIQWTRYKSSDQRDGGGNVTFQLELTHDGYIWCHYYLTEAFGGGFTYGLESPDEQHIIGEMTINNWDPPVQDSTTIVYVPSYTGNTPKGVTEELEIALDGRNVFVHGIYKDTLMLHTNSAAQPLVELPMVINYSGQPVLDVTDSLQWEDVIYNADATEFYIEQDILLRNTGVGSLSVSAMTIANLDGIDLFDDGKELVMSGSGQLSPVLALEPWDEKVLKVRIAVNEKQDIDNGIITINSNAGTKQIAVTASFVEPPVLNWDNSSREFNLGQDQDTSFVFNIQNTGASPLEFGVFPAVKAQGEIGVYPGKIDEIGHYTSEKPTVMDSLLWDNKDNADGYFFSWHGPGQRIAWVNEFTAPEEGFALSHVSSYVKLTSLDKTVKVAVYLGGRFPQEGDTLFNKNYIIDRYTENEWVYFPLNTVIDIPAGQKFFIEVTPHGSTHFMGFDVMPETEEGDELLRKSFNATYGVNDTIIHAFGIDDSGWSNDFHMRHLNKIRGLSAAGEGSWVQLNPSGGTIASGESLEVKASLFPDKGDVGRNYARIITRSNDINNKVDEFDLVMNINGRPQLKMWPNKYTDKLKVTETEEAVWNYLFHDPEGEDMTISIEQTNDTLVPVLVQQGPNLAEVLVKTDYQSAGTYNYPVQIADASGNVTHDTICVQVLNKNRAPVFNKEYEVIELNMADPNVTSFTVNQLFTDPDEDVMRMYAGNYTPHIVDMALGNDFISLHPLQTGTGFVVFAADDGHDDGFTVVGSYVLISNSPDDANSAPYSLDDISQTFINSVKQVMILPNPVCDNNTNVVFKTLEEGDVTLQVYTLQGQLSQTIKLGTFDEGIHVTNIQLGDMMSGMYLCRLIINENQMGTCKMIIK